MDPVSFWATPLGWTLITVGQVLLITVGVLIAVAFLLLADRKVWAGVQMRKGPNVVGPFGLLQSFADMIKFVLKEVVVPASRITLMMIRPSETSYDTICAAERSEPRNGYFEFEAQPPMMMP